MRGVGRVVATVVVAWSAIAGAKGRSPIVETVTLAKARTFDGVELPKRTTVELEARWDDALEQYDTPQLARFTLRSAIKACGTELPARALIEIRRGIPVAIPANAPKSAAVTFVWDTPVEVRIGERTAPTGSTVGVECSSHQLTLLVSPRPFDVGNAHVTYASWYPHDLGGGPLSFQLAQPVELAGALVPAGYVAAFAPNGQLLTLMGDARVGVKFGDRVCWTTTWGDEIRFNDAGYVTCANQLTLNIPCDGRKPIVLDANHLAHCTLSAPFRRGDKSFAAGDEIYPAPDEPEAHWYNWFNAR